ncbi:MAG: hypothetical protein C0455_17605 [Ralstonia sp.]|nr:hypothetical protein [Ralstonia sp.]MBA4237673.1 hypothetical protein [Ralstonia sp.]MBA4402431.1 hypothetical protein [Ralstonia sp.]POH87637.1 hypothetical protein CJ026_012455 [Ralstonia pickettii]
MFSLDVDHDPWDPQQLEIAVWYFNRCCITVGLFFAAHMNDWTGRKYLARRSLPCEAWLSTFSQWAGFIGVLPIPVDGYPSRL